MSLSLLVLIPTRKRRNNCERLLKSFKETTDSAELTFILDGDDDSYDGMDWDIADHVVISPRMPGTRAKLNSAALQCAPDYDALMYIGDDNIFSTPHWDTILLKNLEDMGGSGMVYPDDKRRNDIPETVIISSDIILALGHFMDPMFGMYYVDNVWAELGKRTGLIRYCPEVTVDHMHYTIHPETVERDKIYSESESMWGAVDREAFGKWFTDVMPLQVSMLRRKFNPDVQWILGKV